MRERATPAILMPALPAALAVAGGILTDRVGNVSLSVWMTSLALLVSVSLWLACSSLRIRNAGIVWALLAVCFLLGGLRHHLYWSVRAPHDVTVWADESSPVLVRLRGVVISRVEHRARAQDPLLPVWRRYDQSSFNLEAVELIDGADHDNLSALQPVAGRVRVDVTGQLWGVDYGDRIEVLGRLLRPGPPAAPGEFDYQAHLRRQGIDCVLRCGHPEAITVVGTSEVWGRALIRWRHALRSEAEQLCARYISEPHRALAESILLGERSHLDGDTRQQFIRSGTMHLLAISGLHVGILAGLIWVICGWLNLSPLARAGTVITLLVGYALLTDVRPPVLRATMLGVAAVLGNLINRSVSARNLLAATGLVLLIWRPTDLFDPGALLSFLCVATIIEVAGWPWMQKSVIPEPDDGTVASFWSAVQRRLKYFSRLIGQTYVISLSIWLASLPLTAWMFQVLAPIGTVLNVVLVPFAGVLLGSGFLFLLCGFLLPEAAGIAGKTFDQLLGFLLNCTAWGASLDAGHFFVAAPPLWWLVGFYVSLASAMRWLPGAFPSDWGRRVLLIWVACGLTWGLLPRGGTEVRITFLPVGHGGCVLIETPGGRSVMYDCGSLADGHRATRTALAVLSNRGLDRIDALVISHADMDHYNGIPQLVASIPVGVVWMARSFLDFEQPLIESVCQAIADQGIPMELVSAGDVLAIDPVVRLKVLHPPEPFASEVDNDCSVVLLLECHGRRLLLTGDLEGAGLLEVSQQVLPGPIDVLQSPHHGSPRGNTVELRNWTNPGVVVISGNSSDHLAHVERIFAGSRVLSTGVSGAITVHVAPSGELRVEEYLPRP